MGAITQKLTKVFIDLFVMTWDLYLAVLNLILPKHKPGRVIQPGCPGHKGHWPEYVAPKKGDSRSACPMLNAMVSSHQQLPSNHPTPLQDPQEPIL